MITVQAEAYCEELIKIAKKQDDRDTEVDRVAVTPAGMPFPERPGPTYSRRFFTDALAATLAASAGAGIGHLAMNALERRGGLRLPTPVRIAARAIGPAIAGAGSLALSRGAEDIRKRRLVEAMYKDRENARLKQEKKETK